MIEVAAALVVLIASTGASPRVTPTAAEQVDALRIVVIEGEDAVNIV
jgi:ABC-type phosphate/phosphonate transport system substrate-binding protein